MERFEDQRQFTEGGAAACPAFLATVRSGSTPRAPAAIPSRLGVHPSAKLSRRKTPIRKTGGRGGTPMAEKGKKNKGKRETHRKAQHTLKEKRKLKQEKKKK